jgi:hypothetical protein
MMNFLESSAGRIADRIQSIGTTFDPEVLSLPGGSLIAMVLWGYATITLYTRRAARRAVQSRLPAAAPVVPPVAAACAGCPGHR